MDNPFETISRRLANIESLLLEMKHGQKMIYSGGPAEVGDWVECQVVYDQMKGHLTEGKTYEVFQSGGDHRGRSFTIKDDNGKRRTYLVSNLQFRRLKSHA